MVSPMSQIASAPAPARIVTPSPGWRVHVWPALWLGSQDPVTVANIGMSTSTVVAPVWTTLIASRAPVPVITTGCADAAGAAMSSAARIHPRIRQRRSMPTG
jgi:hypothetical protein